MRIKSESCQNHSEFLLFSQKRRRLSAWTQTFLTELSLLSQVATPAPRTGAVAVAGTAAFLWARRADPNGVPCCHRR